MAHFALLDENNIVVTVLYGRDEDDGKEKELSERTGQTYKQTSYNTRGGVHLNGGTPFRYNFASIGFLFDPSKGKDGAFIAPQPYPSWTLNNDTCLWEAPTAYPTDGKYYIWDESTVSWSEVPLS